VPFRHADGGRAGRRLTRLSHGSPFVAESTIKVDLHEPGAAVAQSPDTVDNPSLGHAWDRAVQGLLNVIAATLIGLGYLIPLLVIAGVAFLIVRLARRRRIAVNEA
jgi:hypothetical protein